MKSYIGGTYYTSQVRLDGYYEDCSFEDCTLVYTGSYVSFNKCKFIRCNWSFQEASGNTLSLLKLLYSGLGEDGRQLVESIFDDIKGIKNGKATN